MYNILIIDKHKNACKRLKTRIKAYLDNQAYLSNIQTVKDISKAIYNEKYNKQLQTPYSGDFARELDMSLKGDYFYNRAKQINHNRGQKITRFSTKIKKMIEIQFCFGFDKFICLFITLTFNDNTLSITSEKTRRQYVHRFLNKTLNSIYYLANIDFGSENEREHYHAVILLKNKDCENNIFRDEKGHRSFSTWQYGFSDLKTAYYNENALAKYINKLCNHRFKNTLENQRAIFPKSEKQLNILYRQVRFWQPGFELFDGEIIVE